MKRRMLEILLYALAPAAIFITSPLLAQGLGVEDRGQLGVIQSVLSFATAVGVLGQADVLMGDLRAGGARPVVARRVALAGGVTSAAFAALVCWLLEVPLPSALLAIALIPIVNQAMLWRVVAVKDGSLRVPAATSALAALARVLIIGALALFGAITLFTAATAVQLSLALAALGTVGLYAFKHRTPATERVTAKQIWSHVVRGLPVLLFTVLTTVTLRADVIVMALISTPEQVGTYAAAASISMAALSVSGAFKSRAQAVTFAPGAQQKLVREFAAIGLVGAVGAILGLVAAPVIVDLLLGPGYQAATGLIRILSFAAAALLVLDAVHGVLSVLGQRTAMAVVGATGALSTVLLLLILVPSYGAIGAACASLASYAIAAAVGALLIRRGLRASGSHYPSIDGSRSSRADAIS